MAPEHLEALAEGSSDRVDGRADLYGLGVLLYEAVVGKKPFQPLRKGQSVVDSLLRAADDAAAGPVALLRRRRPTIPPPLEAVIRRCLAAARRRIAIRPPPSSRPTSGRSPTTCRWSMPASRSLSRIGRRVRRNRRRLVMAAAVLVAAHGDPRRLRQLPVRAIRPLQGSRQVLSEKGSPRWNRREFKEAQIWFDNAYATGPQHRAGRIPQPDELARPSWISAASSGGSWSCSGRARPWTSSRARSR